jgi:stearoyl-CoA desaturase (delta-9 desaturase)
MQITADRLFLIQLIAHIFTIFWIFSIPTLSSILIVLFVYFLTGCLGMSMTYHRLLTHKSWKSPKWFEYLGTVLGTLGCTGSSISWTATHRVHHTKTDKIGDPHSPSILGYVKAQWLSMYSPVDIKRSPVISSKFHQWMHRYYFLVIFLYILLIFLLGGSIISWFFVPACILWNAGSLINTVCHTTALGYRNFSTPDQSSNNPLLGICMWGEGWHNNHHKNQTNPNFSTKWWEIDISYLIIKNVSIYKE